MGSLFTIGYSGLTTSRFLELLRSHKTDVLCDVRSVPHSRYRPEFSRGDLKRSLNDAGIKYAFFGAELGARPKNSSVYRSGQAVHNLIAAKDFFQSGLNRIRTGVVDHTLVLLCSERDPLECHRAVLVCRHLTDLRDQIAHIHTDGRIESHVKFEQRLVAHHNLTPLPLLSGDLQWDAALCEAYDKQSSLIAFTETKSVADATVATP